MNPYGEPPQYGQPPPGGYYQQQQPHPYGYPPPPQGYPASSSASGPSYYPQQYQHHPTSPLPNKQTKPPPPRPLNYDAEAAQAANLAAQFANQQIRSGFVRKVLLIVVAQLLFTAGIACIFIFVDPVKDYVQPGSSGQWLFWVMWGLSLVILISIMCSTTLRRKHPWNILALCLFTLCEAGLVGVICAWWSLDVVVIAFLTTLAVVIGITIIALFMPWDLTKYGFILAMCGMAFMMIVFVSLMVGFFWRGDGEGIKWWYFAISIAGALLFSAYLIYDIQALCGGRAVEISPDEYVFASLKIYLDIVNLFLMLLSIIGIARS